MELFYQHCCNFSEFQSAFLPSEHSGTGGHDSGASVNAGLGGIRASQGGTNGWVLCLWGRGHPLGKWVPREEMKTETLHGKQGWGPSVFSVTQSYCVAPSPAPVAPVKGVHPGPAPCRSAEEHLS